MTHAFFKALLFLGAGSVIHAMSGEQDMRKMGGIWKLIPATYMLMWIGSLALAGVPFFAGYYSKDAILEAAFAAHSPVGTFAFVMGSAAALMTAFYSWRLLIMTFHGKPRADHHTMEHIHESPRIMMMPLVVLAVGAIASGAMFVGGFTGSAHEAGHEADVTHIDETYNAWDKEHFWGDALFVLPENDTVAAAHNVPTWVKLSPVIEGLIGIAFAYLIYMFRAGLADKIAATFGFLHRLFFRKWYFDELYDKVFVQNALKFGRIFWKTGDGAIIDGCGPDGVSNVTHRFAGLLSRLQTGFMAQYAFAMMIGVIALVSWYIYRATLGL
jgi:NADH-quinone oxidoreductase subunit L